jgi:flagellar biosynthetic protein FlhB
MLTLQPLTPDFSRVDPIKGFGRMFSMRALVELMKSCAKLVVMAFVAYAVIKESLPRLVGLQAASPEGALAVLGSLLMELGMKCGLALVVMAAADYAYQRRSHESSLRMSKQDLKEESRQSEGDPHLKSKLRQVALRLARGRMMQRVPTADVVVTNPTHFAVALEYRPESMGAPVVVAKGQDLVAERIKTIATEHGVPIVENPPVARALFRSVEIGGVIPPALYQAVAEVLAFIYRLRNPAPAAVKDHD